MVQTDIHVKPTTKLLLGWVAVALLKVGVMTIFPIFFLCFPQPLLVYVSRLDVCVYLTIIV